MNPSLVHLLPLAGHHHEPAPHRVEGVGHGHGPGGHGLRDGELGADGWVVDHLLGSVVGAEVDGAVDYDALDGAEEAGVEAADETVGLVRLGDAVPEALQV